jgi:hypothetical protein
MVPSASLNAPKVSVAFLFLPCFFVLSVWTTRFCIEAPMTSAGHSDNLQANAFASKWHPILAVRLRHIHTVLLLCNKVHVHVAKNRAFGSASALARPIGLILIPLKLPMNQIRYALLPGKCSQASLTAIRVHYSQRSARPGSRYPDGPLARGHRLAVTANRKYL